MINKCLYDKTVANFGLRYILIIIWQQSIGGKISKNVDFPGAGDSEDAGLIPGQEDPLEEKMATHSSILA